MIINNTLLHSTARPMVEVFKTNVQEITTAGELVDALSRLIPDSRINFDLDDCDRILRICSEFLDPKLIMDTMNAHGFECELLI